MSLANERNIEEKQPIRRLEIPISKFNDVAIPHHLDLLRRHRNNIERYRKMRNWELVRKEQINAARSTRQLEQLLHEMDALRTRVQDSDIAKFDKLTLNSRKGTVAAIEEYLELRPDPQLALPSRFESPKDENETSAHPLDQCQIQSYASEEDAQQRQEACLHAWNTLQRDLQQLHRLFVDFNRLIIEQRERVDSAENHVNETDTNVQEGVGYLRKASTYRAAAYPIAGALLGTCLGGPVGLIAGFKLGGLTAIGGGLLGFTGATLLKKRQLAVKAVECRGEEDERMLMDRRDSIASQKQDESFDSKKRL